MGQKKIPKKAQMILARPSRGDERSGIVASDYIVYLFASIEIKRQRVLPGSVYIILSSNESAYVLTHRGTSVTIRDESFETPNFWDLHTRMLFYSWFGKSFETPYL